MKSPQKRQQILEAAYQLFVLRGFNGTGVDQIAAESGVTKRTLYKHFGTKEGLIREVLKEHHAEMVASLQERILDQDLDAREKLFAYFDYYFDWFSAPHFNGCIFIKTLNEFGGYSTELGGIAQKAKNSMRDCMRQIAQEGGLDNPAQLAMQLQLLLEGSIIMAQAGQKQEAMQAAKAVARGLIRTS